MSLPSGISEAGRVGRRRRHGHGPATGRTRRRTCDDGEDWSDDEQGARIAPRIAVAYDPGRAQLAAGDPRPGDRGQKGLAVAVRPRPAGRGRALRSGRR
ncbi:protein of unknown function [Modestobacter italicus]|uniref:Uncharacterized protein n=1 Tax=Modestobacter italicus (strain DSM 44449 / CECT 9708 / BC 501) TaxID=2732864 RepID=I4ERA3_MODI5|nr:protein of unknown function [Modestobacter marinus]